MIGLTQRQADLLTYLRECEAKGRTPSFEEMKDAVRLQSKSGVQRLILALEERGFIRRVPNRARSIELLSESERAARPLSLSSFADSEIAAEYRRRFKRVH